MGEPGGGEEPQWSAGDIRLYDVSAGFGGGQDYRAPNGDEDKFRGFDGSGGGGASGRGNPFGLSDGQWALVVGGGAVLTSVILVGVSCKVYGRRFIQWWSGQGSGGRRALLPPGPNRPPLVRGPPERPALPAPSPTRHRRNEAELLRDENEALDGGHVEPVGDETWGIDEKNRLQKR